MKNSSKLSLKTGDSVSVKKGLKHPFFDKYDIGGWQGWIVDIYDEMDFCEDCKERETCDIYEEKGTLLDIEFDSITLKQMPEQMIKDLIDEDDDFAMATLSTTIMKITNARDTVEETKAARLSINLLYNYISKLDQDHDTMFCVTQSGMKLEENGLRITDIPYFAQSLSEETKIELKDFLHHEELEKQQAKKEKERLDKIKALKSRKGGLIPIEEFVENIPMHKKLSLSLRNLVKWKAAYFINDISKVEFMKYIGNGRVRWEQLLHIIHHGLKGTKYAKLEGKLKKHFAEQEKKK